MKLINIGFGNMVNASRLVAIVSPESAPIKRIIQECKDPHRRNSRQTDKSGYNNRQRPCNPYISSERNGSQQAQR